MEGYDGDLLWASTAADITWDTNVAEHTTFYIWQRPRDIRFNTEHQRLVQERIKASRAAQQAQLRKQEADYNANMLAQIAEYEAKLAADQRQHQPQQRQRQHQQAPQTPPASR